MHPKHHDSTTSPVTSSLMIEQWVHELWLEQPGLGVKALLEQCRERFSSSLSSSNPNHPRPILESEQQQPPQTNATDDGPKSTVIHMITKQQIRQAKLTIPYRKIDSNDHNDDPAEQNEPPEQPQPQQHPSNRQQQQDAFVQEQIRQRQMFRQDKQFAQADRISAGLETMGVVLDDNYKTWRWDPAKRNAAIDAAMVVSTTRQNSNTTAKTTTKNTPCQMCGQPFASRNAVFAHLRDPTTPCGNAIFQSGQSLPESPAKQQKKQQHRQQRQQRQQHAGGRGQQPPPPQQQQQQPNGSSNDSNNNQPQPQSATINNNNTTTIHSLNNNIQKPKQRYNLDACLWMGDLPLPWSRLGGQTKRFRALLRHLLPRNVPPPFIKSMIRKGYRQRRRQEQPQPTRPRPQQQRDENDKDKNENEQDDDDDKNNPNSSATDNGTTKNGNHKDFAKHTEHNNHNNTLTTTTTSDYLGYAIVVFRDAEEAELVRVALDGINVEPHDVFRDHVLFLEKKKKMRTTASSSNTADDEDGNGRDEQKQTDSNETTETATDTMSKKDKQQKQQQQKEEESLALLNLPAFTLKVRMAQAEKKTSRQKGEHDDDANRTTTNLSAISGDANSLPLTEPGQDPPLYHQLGPLSTHELKKRHQHWKEFMSMQSETMTDDEQQPPNVGAPLSKTQEHKQILQRLVQCYETRDPRIVIRRQGKLIPQSLRDELLQVLKSLRWPARNERPALSSEQYLVLRSNVNHERYYGNLQEACRKLMEWVDPSYHYSGIAVTKNFVASPHVDELDQSFQYAISLGDFDQGGELCVSGQRNASGGQLEYIVNVVNTHDRIARVDGRQVHWVRTWNNTATTTTTTTNRQQKDDDKGENSVPSLGDRYSLIFYDTSHRNVTPLNLLGVDEGFLGREDDV